MNNVLIWGKSGKEHLQNLEKVVAIIHKHGIKPKKVKYIFFYQRRDLFGISN